MYRSRCRKLAASLGREVYSVFDESAGIPDEDILSKAFSENWILVTNDRDFGELIFRERRPHKGVVFLRLADERSSNKITVLRKVLEEHSDNLASHFVTVTEDKIRIS